MHFLAPMFDKLIAFIEMSHKSLTFSFYGKTDRCSNAGSILQFPWPRGTLCHLAPLPHSATFTLPTSLPLLRFLFLWSCVTASHWPLIMALPFTLFGVF